MARIFSGTRRRALALAERSHMIVQRRAQSIKPHAAGPRYVLIVSTTISTDSHAAGLSDHPNAETLLEAPVLRVADRTDSANSPTSNLLLCGLEKFSSEYAHDHFGAALWPHLRPAQKNRVRFSEGFEDNSSIKSPAWATLRISLLSVVRT